MDKVWTDLLLKALGKNGLHVEGGWSQGYDNGTNMSSIDNGVQARILNINLRAHSFYMIVIP